jgi:hypothetical protein
VYVSSYRPGLLLALGGNLGISFMTYVSSSLVSAIHNLSDLFSGTLAAS